MENGFIIKTSRINRNFADKQKRKNESGKQRSRRPAYTKQSRNGWKREV